MCDHVLVSNKDDEIDNIHHNKGEYLKTNSSVFFENTYDGIKLNRSLQKYIH